MKKYTNKILLIAAIALTLLIFSVITIDFQVKYHKNPEQFKKRVNTGVVISEIPEDAVEVNEANVEQN